MAMRVVIALFIMSGAGAAKLRAASGAQVWSEVEQSMFNSTIPNRVWSHTVGLLQREIEMVEEKPPVVNKVIYVLLSCVFGYCGIDRCFMGQILMGCLKGFTCGGFLIWGFIDYVLALYHAVSKTTEIHDLGYHATFDPTTIDGAFVIGILFCLYYAYTMWRQYQAYCLVQKLLEVHVESCVAQSKESPDTPMRQNSVAYMPTMLVKNLRKGGLIEGKPQTHELLLMFEKMDKNGDGQLDHDEIKEAMSNVGASEEDIDEMIKCADTDGDGKISKNEFLVNLCQQDK